MKMILEDKVIAFPEDTFWSEQEFFDFCMVNPDLNLERDKEGNILVTSPVNFTSANLELRAGGALDAWNIKTGLGYVFSSNAAFRLSNGALRSPDVAWIEASRVEALPASERESFAHICPDFVIEIRSKTDRLKQLQEKMEEYIDNGCRLGFLIDPYSQQAWIYRPENDPELVDDFRGTLSGTPVLPGFALDLGIFKIK